jgi:hypothetical protein
MKSIIFADSSMTVLAEKINAWLRGILIDVVSMQYAATSREYSVSLLYQERGE